ncbi:MAG: hypothetical protein Marn2KO_11980 [Marinobacter nauticus]
MRLIEETLDHLIKPPLVGVLQIEFHDYLRTCLPPIVAVARRGNIGRAGKQTGQASQTDWFTFWRC